MTSTWAHQFQLELHDNDVVALGNGGNGGAGGTSGAGGAGGAGGNFSNNTIDISTGNEFHFSAGYNPQSFRMTVEDNDVVALGNGGDGGAGGTSGAGGAGGAGGDFNHNDITIDTGNDFHFG